MNTAHVRPIPNAVATQGLDVRRAFIRRTYAHLLLAIGVFALSAFLLVTSGFAESMTRWAVFGGMLNQLLLIGGFIAVGYLSHKWAYSGATKGMQYVGLFTGAIGYAVFFTPILYIAAFHTGVDGSMLIAKAGIFTGLIFVGLTMTVFITKKDFSFLRNILMMATFAALGLILIAVVTQGGLDLGAWFSGAMVVLMAGWVLWRTSQVMQHYPPTAHVAAALGLFADIAMMFYYILALLMQLQSD